MRQFITLGDGGLASLLLGFDASGRAQVDPEAVLTLDLSAAPAGCSVRTTPADPELPGLVCNSLHGGKMALLCDPATTDHLALAFLDAANVQPATLDDYRGKTLVGLSCGVAGVQANANTASISTTGMAQVVLGKSTWNYPADGMDAAAGRQMSGWLQKWFLYKVQEPTGTTYYLFDIYQFPDGTPDAGRLRPNVFRIAG